MRYWGDDQVNERDLVEGEAIWDPDHPAPAVKGVKLLSNGENVLYEVEAVPGTVREETLVSPILFVDETGLAVDVICRDNRMIDGKEVVREFKYTIMLSCLGYKDRLPESSKVIENPAFDRAMEMF